MVSLIFFKSLESVYIAVLMPFINQAVLCKGASLVRFLITCKELEMRLLVQ